MRETKKGFTLIELLVVVAIIALLISILLPSLSRARELAKRLVCAANVKGIGTAFKIYSNENQEQWATPLFSEPAVGAPAIVIVYTGAALPAYNATPLRTLATTNTSVQLSVTRAFWLMIRSGETTQKQYICPSSGDETDVTEEIEKYYDFYSMANISYGYQVPFGPKETRASENLDPRQPVAADASPYTAAAITDPPDSFNIATSPRLWQPYNSGNHGGSGAGEGQNVLYQDGHAIFERKPIVGIDNDNIYTHMVNADWVMGSGRFSGTSPWISPINPYPGQDSLPGPKLAQTDTLIFP
jgi:prepilin-type N-terminal cleavage/methylation domain-containing protein